MSNFQNIIFGPLGKESCNLFYFFTAFAFFSLIVFLILSLLLFLKQPKKISFTVLFNGILLFINLLLTYFVNRIFYNICIKTL